MGEFLNELHLVLRIVTDIVFIGVTVIFAKKIWNVKVIKRK